MFGECCRRLPHFSGCVLLSSQSTVLWCCLWWSHCSEPPFWSTTLIKRCGRFWSAGSGRSQSTKVRLLEWKLLWWVFLTSLPKVGAQVKFSEFIARHLGEREGCLLEAETGELLGTHKGFWFYTIGQRQGIGLSNGPWFVPLLAAFLSQEISLMCCGLSGGPFLLMLAELRFCFKVNMLLVWINIFMISLFER